MLRLSSQKGNIVIALAAALVVSVASLFYYFFQYVEMQKAINYRYVFTASLKQLTLNTQALMDSQKSLVNSIKAAENKTGGDLERCIFDATYDCPPGPFPYSVYSDDGSIYIDNSNTTSGYTLDMQPCANYNSAFNNACLARLDLQWSPECPVFGPCRQPAILIRGDVLLKDSFAKKNSINLDLLSFMKRVN